MSISHIQPFKVVVAEDTSDIRILLALQLRMLGYTVFEACDGREAVDLARRMVPDLILMDLNMPVMNGFEATRRIREERFLDTVKIVAFSALPSSEKRVEAIAAGCDEFAEKNLELGRIKALMGRLLQKD
jgi:CheY-like chemotaxis protein